MNSIEINKRIIKEFVDATNNRDWPKLTILVHPQLVRHTTTFGQPQVRSARELLQFHQQEAEVFPDLQETIRLMVAEGDKVAALIAFEGTQSGTMGKFPASGKKMTANFICIFRIEQEMIREIWVEYDTLTGLVQLGHFDPDV